MIRPTLPRWMLAFAIALTAAVYWPGLSGGWLFDDYPNIVDNHGVQPHDASLPSLAAAALSSPASEFKRPLASLSFAANYLATGLDPYSWKLVNLILHLLNGLLVYVLAKNILRSIETPSPPPPRHAGEGGQHADALAALIAAGWMLLPINLTAVLYVVQRMESLANLFVLLGLIGYVAGRRRMLHAIPLSNQVRDRLFKQEDEFDGEHCTPEDEQKPPPAPARRGGLGWGGFWLCIASLTLPTTIGLLAKETAVMLPLYACLIEWIVFRFRHAPASVEAQPVHKATPGGESSAHGIRSSGGAIRDGRIVGLFVCVLLLPIAIGLAWLLPSVLAPATWATRDFTLGQRLFSETRIVCDYIAWTLLPTPHALSFYHDQFPISKGLLTPWTTLASLLALAVLVVVVIRRRDRQPLLALGISLFLGCQLLTATILPLELVYEHRNYFASFGLMLAVVPLLAVPMTQPMALPRRVLLGGLLLLWAGQTAITASCWRNPLLLAETLAARAPDSPRAQYELGRTYIIYSNYDPASPFTRLAYAPLERAAALPNASILPEQALIFMNARMHLPIKEAWWNSLIGKLKSRRPGVQDESSLGALTQCAHQGKCNLPKARMVDAYLAALSHPHPSARLLAMYGDYAWNVLDDHALGLRMIEGAVQAAPREPAYHITLARMLATQGRYAEVKQQIEALQKLDIGGRLDRDIAGVRALLPVSSVR